MPAPKEYARLKARMEKLEVKADRLEAEYKSAVAEHDAAADLFLDYCSRTGRNDDTGEKWTPEELARQMEQLQRCAEIHAANKGE